MQEEILRARECLLTTGEKSSVASVLKLLEQTYKKLCDYGGVKQHPKVIANHQCMADVGNPVLNKNNQVLSRSLLDNNLCICFATNRKLKEWVLLRTK